MAERTSSSLFVSASVAALLASALAVSGAQAQTKASTAPTTVEDVVVTARKREESLQQVPVAVTAQTGEQLEAMGVRSTTDLGRFVPSLTVSSNASQNSSAVFSIRGQTAGDVLLTVSQPVGVYEDSGNIPLPTGLLSAFFDIERVEVLKGPQGTLYGRNTTGGAVNIITRGADFDGQHGYVGGELGNHNDWRVNGAVNLPLIADKLAVRLAYQHWDREGYGQSRTSGQDLGGDHKDDIGRLSVLFQPTDDIRSVTKVSYLHTDQNGYLNTLHQFQTNPALEAGLESGCGSFANIPALAGCGTAALSQDLTRGDIFTNGAQSLSSDRTKVWHVVEDLSWSLNKDVELRSITTYHDVLNRQKLDLDTSRFQILEINQQLIAPFSQNPNPHEPDTDYYQWSQEVNLSGQAGRVNWIVGAYGSWLKGTGAQCAQILSRVQNGTDGCSSISNGVKTDTWAVYTQEDVKLNDQFSLTLGLRYTEESQDNKAAPYTFRSATNTLLCANGNGVVPANALASCPVVSSSIDSNGVSYLASLNYQVTPQTLLYVKTAKGFRGGALQFRAPTLPGVQPETATDYEVGLKSDFFDGRLRTNLAAYHTDYSNKQETVIITGAGGAPTTVLQNAASAKIDGFEAEVTAIPVAGWSIYGTLTLLEGKYKTYENPLSGDGGLLFAGNPVCAARPNPVPDQCIAKGIGFPDAKQRYSIGSRYEFDLGPGQLALQADWAWRSRMKDTPLNLVNGFGATGIALQRGFRKPIGLLNARIQYDLPEHDISLAVFATNLLNKKYQIPGLVSPALGIFTATTQEPRMYGVTIRKSFGGE